MAGMDGTISSSANTNINDDFITNEHDETLEEQKDNLNTDPGSTVEYNKEDNIGEDTKEDEEFDENEVFLHSFEHSVNVADITDHFYAGKLASGADFARKGGHFCDITLLVGEEKHPIKAHRLILASAFDYFKAMLTADFKEGSQSEVNLPKADVQTMESLIDFAYTGKIKLDDHNIEKAINAANFFGMPTLLESCVHYIMGKINKSNCIEMLEFADHISNQVLREFAIKYITENLQTIIAKNLDIVGMSTHLLLEIIASNNTSLHPDPTQNEEGLFQIGWNNLHSKPNDHWEAFLPRLLRAVHLPQVSEDFLHDLERKVAECNEASNLIAKAKIMKQDIVNYRATTEAPKINADLRWQMSRFQTSVGLSVTSGLFVTCHGIKEDLNNDWYGAPAFINGEAWCLRATIETSTEDGPPVKYITAYLYCLSDLHCKSVITKYRFEIMKPKNSQKYVFSCSLDSDGESTFDEKGSAWGKKLTKLSNVLYNYHDAEKDSCTINAHIKDVKVESKDQNN